MNLRIAKVCCATLFCLVMENGCSLDTRPETNLPRPENNRTNSNMNMLEKSFQIPAGDVRVSFSVVEPRIVKNQPVLIKFVVENRLEQTISLDLGQNLKENFRFAIVFPDGKKVQTPSLTKEGISLPGDIEIAPQQLYSQNLLLNEWGVLDEIGEYHLEYDLNAPIKTKQGDTVPVDSSGKIKFAIEPENKKHLEKVSEALFNKFDEAKSYSEAVESVRTLSYVKSSVAVPYLRKALASNKMVESTIVNILRERGDVDSVDVLVWIIKEQPNSETATAAKSALEWISATTKDPNVKSKIQKVL